MKHGFISYPSQEGMAGGLGGLSHDGVTSRAALQYWCCRLSAVSHAVGFGDAAGTRREDTLLPPGTW